MAQGGNSDLSLRHDLFRAFCCEADQSGTHGWRNKRCCVECNTEHCEAAGEIAANGKTKLAQHIYHVHMIPLPGDYRRRGGGWTHLSDKPSEFARNVRALVNVIGVDYVHRYGY
jgi:hypothetical protein